MSSFALLASARTAAAFSAGNAKTSFLRQATRSFSRTTLSSAAVDGQAEVVLVGCGAPNRGMGWYHAIQMIEGK